MSVVKSNAHQVGQSATAANNFTLYQPSTPDGTVRLGVGNAGATTTDVITASSTGVTIPSVSSSNTFGFKNALINGNFNINQRGVSGTVTLSAGSYGHDRWKAGASGCTYTFSTTNNVTTLTITAGSLQQVIEGLNVQSATYILSWTGTAQGRINSGSYGASGAVTASLTGGTNQTVEFNTGTLTLAQCEIGSRATSFDFRSYGQELALCQRYYEIVTGSFRAYTSDGCVAGPAPFKVTKRASPTCTYIASGNNNLSGAVGNFVSGFESGTDLQACFPQWCPGTGTFYSYGYKITASAEL